MEEEQKEKKKEIIQKEVKLLTFDPILMQTEIRQLKERILQYEEELIHSKKGSLKFLLQNVLLELFGGHYISEEELKNAKIRKEKKNKK